MSFEFYKESYAGAIKAISIGKGDKAVTVGGETCYPLYQFEGEMPHKPKIAMEIWDTEPGEWPAAALEPFKDVVSDPAAWAKKCVDEFGAEIIVLQLKSIDPNGDDASPADASATVKKVLGAIDVPLVVWGIANHEKDEAVFKQIAEDCQDVQLTLGPVEDKNHKGIGAAAMGYGHALISSSPIDVNLAKQVNILLENLGMPMDRVIIDPTTGGLGYGLEYSYSVMERLRMAAMAQGDDKLQMPIINNLANEIWKCKEAKQDVDEAPTLGDPEKRGILMEAVGAVTYLVAGSDILIMRHPEAIRLVKAFIDIAMDGGSAADIAPIAKRLEGVSVDLAALAPEVDLTIEEEKKAAKPAAKAAPKAAAKPAAKAAAKPAAAKKEKDWGYINSKGEWIVNPQFEKARPFGATRAMVKKGGEWGWIDNKGKYVIQYTFSSWTEPKKKDLWKGKIASNKINIENKKTFCLFDSLICFKKIMIAASRKNTAASLLEIGSILSRVDIE